MAKCTVTSPTWPRTRDSTKSAKKVVHHQARKYGKTKFGGLNRFFNGYLDLLSLWFLSTFGVKPMHIFGFLGSIMFFLGIHFRGGHRHQ